MVRISIVNPIRIYYRNPYQNPNFFQIDVENLVLRVEKKIGDLSWLDYRSLKDGANAFREIHDGVTASPKIILLP